MELCLCPKGLFGRISKYGNVALILILHTGRILGLIFKWETEGLRTRVLNVNCSCISELDVSF